MLSLRTLKNININILEDFLSLHKVVGRSRDTKASSTPERYSKILNLIKNELETKSSFTALELEDFIFENLFYINMNRTFVYRFNSFFANSGTDVGAAIKFIQQHPNLFYNSFLNNTINNSSSFHLCTTRIESDPHGNLMYMHLLLKVDSKQLTWGNTYIFSGVTIDIKNKIVLIKFGQNELKEIDGGPIRIIQLIKDALNGTGLLGDTTEPFQLNVISLNEDTVKSAIYDLFQELSNEAEEILNERVLQEDISKIRDFLTNTVKLREVKDEYVEQIKAVLYQDIISHISPSVFKKGWVFRFHYQEGDHTRLTSKQEDHSPVYKSKTFWQLKELIYKTPKMQEGGFHWYLVDNKQIENFVDVRITAINDTMEVYHYSKNRETRKEKEKFVLQKVAPYLS